MKLKAILSIVLTLSLMLSACALAEEARLVVQGTGMVSLDPDTATITLGVQETAKDVSEAQHTVNAKLAQVIETLKSMGVKDEDIHTSSIEIYEEYRYDSYDSLGSDSKDRYYNASNNISVTIKDIENAGEYIDAVFKAGANTFSHIAFDASDTEAAKKRALELSVENARKKAEILAAAAGMAITGVTAISEQGAGVYGNYAAVNTLDVAMEKAEAESDAGTQVFSEQIQVSATVTVEYTMASVGQ